MALIQWKNRDLHYPWDTNDPWTGLKQLQDEINDLIDIDRNKIDAELQKGILRLTLHIKESEKPRKINVVSK